MNSNPARLCGIAKELRAELARAAAASASTVLLQLENGMPWSEAQRLLHELGRHPAATFRTLTCSSTSTSALRDQLLAVGVGTLCLHDVARLGQETQVWLASVLSQRRCDGAPLEARIVANLFDEPERLVERGELRADLLYRLNGLFVRPRPLRERGSEIEPLALELARHFADCDAFSERAPTLTPAARAALRAHAWPANERELELVLERAVLLAGGGAIDVAHLGLSSSAAARNPEVLPLGDRSLRSVEEALIRRVLDEQGGNKSRAAVVLGLHRATLHEKLQAFDSAV